MQHHQDTDPFHHHGGAQENSTNDASMKSSSLYIHNLNTLALVANKIGETISVSSQLSYNHTLHDERTSIEKM